MAQTNHNGERRYRRGSEREPDFFRPVGHHAFLCSTRLDAYFDEFAAQLRSTPD
jgi:hypothetical protein